MSAVILSALPADSPPDQTAIARFLLALHPFTAVCLIAQWLDDPIKTVIHRDTAALILEESEHLCRILTVEDFEKDRKPFWVYRKATKKEENHVEAFWRGRIGETLTAPCWHGEEEPKGYRKVKLKTRFPSFGLLCRLATLAYPWSAAGAALPRGHQLSMRPVSDRRTRGVTYKSDDDGKNGNETKTQKRDSHGFIDVAHPYVPMAPARRTLVGGGIPVTQVTQEIARHRWDDVTSCCVFEIVYRRASPSELSEKHGVPLRRLHEYARQIRRAIKSNPGNAFAR